MVCRELSDALSSITCQRSSLTSIEALLPILTWLEEQSCIFFGIIHLSDLYEPQLSASINWVQSVGTVKKFNYYLLPWKEQQFPLFIKGDFVLVAISFHFAFF